MGTRRSSLNILRFYLYRLAEKLLEKETLSLPDIVDTLGQRPYPIKETLKDYLQELRDRQEQDDEIAEEEKKANEAKMAAIEDTKFDPDAEEPPAEDAPESEKQKSDDSADAAAAGEDKKPSDSNDSNEEEKK